MSFWVHQAAARRPETIAIAGPERSLTYAELSAAAAAAARALQTLGVRGGDRVALALGPGEDFVVALHGCMQLDAAVVPVDLRHSQAERARRLAGAQFVVSEPLSGPRGLFPSAGGDGEHVLAVMHTSGTTSDPKPVALTAANFLASALGSAVALGLHQAERWLCPMPLTHFGGLSIPIRSAIYATTVVLHGRFDTAAVLGELMDPSRAITLVSLVPTMLSRLLDAGLAHPPTLRWALLGGGPLAPALLQRAQAAGVPVAPTYGMTECCSQIATFGYPLPGVELRLSGGEIMVRGPIVAPASTDERGWLATGDLGHFDERSRLVITGRKSDTIITGGENVAPTEIEDVLVGHPAVADAGVHARPDAEWGEAIVAAVVLRDGAQVSAAELQAHCAARLARFKVPKDVRFVAALPRTTSGKLVRRELAGTV
jgi:o-succinylbenzoate---CoA ligase